MTTGSHCRHAYHRQHEAKFGTRVLEKMGINNLAQESGRAAGFAIRSAVEHLSIGLVEKTVYHNVEEERRTDGPTNSIRRPVDPQATKAYFTLDYGRAPRHDEQLT